MFYVTCLQQMRRKQKIMILLGKISQARNNNELVAIFGNFINRVMVLTHNYYKGVTPAPGSFTEVDKEVLSKLRSYPANIASSIERYRFKEAQAVWMNLARIGNKYLADEEPWHTVKTDEERTQTIMYVALQVATALAVLGEPFLPHTSKKLKDMLQRSEERRVGKESRSRRLPAT